MVQQLYDREKLHLNLARLKKGGETFEVVLSDVDKALELRSGKKVYIREVMNGDQLFKDARGAKKVSEHKMREILGTEDHFKAAKKIIQEGKIQITEDQRNRITERKKSKIIHYIHRNACDSKSKRPIPVKRIELAMDEAGVRVDLSENVSYQIKKIIPKLRPILPLSFENIKLRAVIPKKYAGSAYSAVKSNYNPKKEKWRTDGSVQLEFEIVAGKKNDLFSLLNKTTSGEVQIKEI